MNQISSKSPIRSSTTSTCYHCGDSCVDQAIVYEQKAFCCEGCKMVYSILQENDLGNFYTLNPIAGTSQKSKRKATYAFLDDPEAQRKLISFQDERQTKIRFYLPQIHCSSCLWLLENLHRLNESVLHSRVDFLKREASITFAPTNLSLRELVELLDRIGYPPQINLQDLENEVKPTTDKSLYYKLGLAGFAFGNIMLLSFPEYLGLDPSSNTALVTFFGYVSIALVLPVVFYSGWEYLHSAWQGIRQRHLNIDLPVSLGILALFFRSSYEILTHTGAGYLDSLAGLIFFLLIGKWFQQKTYARLAFDRDYKSYFPIACTRKEGNQEIPVTLDKIKVGDLLLIRHGELIPADAILCEGIATIDYSFVTGESELIKKEKGDQVYAGGRQEGGLIVVQVSKKVSNSYLTQLWNEDTFIKSKAVGQVSVLADRVAGIFTFVILSVAFLTLVYWLYIDPKVAINAFTAVLIIACPCAVALSIPFTFGNSLRLLSRKGIYLKNTAVIENLAQISHIVFDKTGTITNTTSGQMTYQGTVLSETEKQGILSLVYHSTHPLSRGIKAHFKTYTPLSVEIFQEFEGQGITGKVGQLSIKLGSADFVQGGKGRSKKNQEVLVSIDGHFKGTFIYQGQYRKGLTETIAQLQSWAHLSLLSGDNDHEKGRLQPFFEQLYFNKKPKEKLQHIQALQKDKKVAMIGDGLNDAGALSQSHVGIVISENTSNFTPACDIIMDASQFHQLPALFAYARKNIQVVYLAYTIALLYNIIGLTYAVQGALSPVIAAILMPLSSITIVLLGVGASTWLAYRKGF